MQAMNEREQKIYLKNFCSVCQSSGHPLSPLIKKFRQELYLAHLAKAYLTNYHTFTLDINIFPTGIL